MQKQLLQCWYLPNVRSNLSVPAKAADGAEQEAITANGAAKFAEWVDMAAIDFRRGSFSQC